MRLLSARVDGELDGEDEVERREGEEGKRNGRQCVLGYGEGET